MKPSRRGLPRYEPKKHEAHAYHPCSASLLYGKRRWCKECDKMILAYRRYTGCSETEAAEWLARNAERSSIPTK